MPLCPKLVGALQGAPHRHFCWKLPSESVLKSWSCFWVVSVPAVVLRSSPISSGLAHQDLDSARYKYKGTLLGTPNRDYLLYSWGSWFGVPSRVPLKYLNLPNAQTAPTKCHMALSHPPRMAWWNACSRSGAFVVQTMSGRSQRLGTCLHATLQ